MKSNKVKKKYLKKLFSAMETHLEAFRSSADQTELHQFRVQVKKFRSLLEMGKCFNALSFRDDFSSLKKVFGKAGAIRDMYLHTTQFQANDQPEPGFVKQEHDKFQKQIADFTKNVPEYLHCLHKNHKRALRLLSFRKRSIICKFYNHELERILLTLSKQDFSEKMHRCRKRIKNLLYNQKFSEKLLRRKIHLHLPYLNTLQEMIGSWHDTVVSMQLLKQHDSNVSLDSLEARKADLEKKIKDTSSGFWQKVTDKVSGI